MKLKNTNRQSIFALIIFLYVIPLFFFSSYSISIMPRSKSWLIVSIGLLMIAGGSILFLLLLRYLEQSLKPVTIPDYSEKLGGATEKVTQFDPIQSLKEYSETQYAIETAELADLRSNLEKKQEDQSRLLEDNKLLTAKTAQTTQEYNDYKIFSEEQLKQKSLQNQALQIRIDDQQEEQKKLHEQIEQLNCKVNDLTYEIRTLISLNDEAAPIKHPNSIKSSEEHRSQGETNKHQALTRSDASLLLKRCINTAQKITGSIYHGSESSRYRNYTPTLSTIDLRRLYDSLRLENEALIIVYSPKEQKFLFANQQSKSLLGWSPDKLIQGFPSLIQDGLEEWENAVRTLSSQPESKLRLLIKTKMGDDLYIECHLSLIPMGLFKHYIIGVMYQNTP